MFLWVICLFIYIKNKYVFMGKYFKKSYFKLILIISCHSIFILFIKHKMFNNDNFNSRSCDENKISDSGSCSSESSWYTWEKDDCKSECKDRVKIPKIIMQTWKNNDVPDKWKVSPESIKRKMPGWKYVLMTDEDNRNFVKKYFPDFLSYYDGFTHNIQRADAIRYMWLYINGGIYIDLDFEVKHRLDSLFYTDAEAYFVCSGNIGSYITNSFMASKPGAKIWLEMIEYMKKPLDWYCRGKHFEVMVSTGPIMVNHVVKKSKYVFAMLPSKLVMPNSVCDIKRKVPGAYLQPLEGSSWISYDTKIYNFLLCKWKKLLIFLVILIILLLIVLFIWWLDVL
jgi:inositol phosphorylceramide mannosyltransferase catalytic subunit